MKVAELEGAELEPGYYWARLKTFKIWEIARVAGNHIIHLPGRQYRYRDDDFIEIGPKITPPYNNEVSDE